MPTHFKRLKSEFSDFGRTDDGLEKCLKIFGKERRTSEKNSFEITSHFAQDIFAIARKFQNSVKTNKFYVKSGYFPLTK